MKKYLPYIVGALVLVVLVFRFLPKSQKAVTVPGPEFDAEEPPVKASVE